MKLKDYIDREKKEYLHKIKEIAQDRKIIIYGVGKIGRELHRFLLSHGITIDGFCVTESTLNRNNEGGKIVYVFEDLVAHCDSINDFCFLVGAKTPVKEKIVANLSQYKGTIYIDAPEHIEQMVDETFFRPMLEITTKIGCAINCHFCPQSLLVRKYKAKHHETMMSLDTFKRCIDKTPQNTIIRFAGFVEPFLNPQAIDILKYAHESGRELSLFTTLMGLNIGDITQLSALPYREVVLHLPDEKNYAHIPITEEYLTVLKEAVTAKKSDGTPWIDQTNAQARPPQQIIDMLQGRFTISWEVFDRAGNIDDDSARSKTEPKGAIYCQVSEQLNRNILLPDGTVVLCCMDYGLEVELGNLLHDSYETIVTGDVMEQVRDEMLALNGNKKFLCRRCTHAGKVNWEEGT